MRGPVYRYNTETCRYERAKISIPSVFTYGLGLLFCSALMLTGMLKIHDLVVDSKKEKALRKENKAIERGQVVLTKHLDEIDEKLTTLESRDSALHFKFFLTKPDNQIKTAQRSKQNMLLADASGWLSEKNVIDAKSSLLIQQAESANESFSEQLNWQSRKNLLHSLPSIPPVEEFRNENVMSGFGDRINPFHKALYKHNGLDIALPRGSSVLSTANGTVVVTKHSSLQAGLGTYIEIDHGNGFSTRYANLDDIIVRQGESVTKGMRIGISGNSGGSVAPHLHYEVLRFGKPLDPVDFLIETLSPLSHAYLREISNKQNQSLD
jgi:murein DD-endopeptidase MepM/ murein hydrolase activator NlpD